MGDQPYVTIRSRRPADNAEAAGANGMNSPHPADFHPRSATHDTSRASYHVKHLSQFAQRLEDSAARAFPNRGRCSQRYKKVQALLLHWISDDLFVIPELEDLEKCLREDYSFETDIFPIPAENSHLELMMRVGQLIKQHESEDTLFLVYYGGHAKIDESRQSTWCATRDAGSPWLQWSAIQTLLERSKSDVLILLDCCAGAASATFPNGVSITETISASSWDAIAPDPGRYSFTSTLIDVLQQWRGRTFSAAMLHAEVLARLKHPRPILINGKLFEARSTPVHFMMTANHKAASIELSRTLGEDELPSSPPEMQRGVAETGRAAESSSSAYNEPIISEPNEDTPHVMISLALEDDQRLDINAWDQWLAAFPAMAKYVKVQGVFKSHSTLLLVSMPVTVWDLLPEDHATSFVAFIRSNNLISQRTQRPTYPITTRTSDSHSEILRDDSTIATYVSGTTVTPTVHLGNPPNAYDRHTPTHIPSTPSQIYPAESLHSFHDSQRTQSSSPVWSVSQPILNQQQSLRRTTFGNQVPEPKKFSAHIEKRLEEYYKTEPFPSDGQRLFYASNLGVESWDVEVWFHHRRERDVFTQNFASLPSDVASFHQGQGPSMILPADLNELLDIALPGEAIVFDLRAPSDYQKSHIRGSMHLRLPQSFLALAPLEMIERGLTEDSSRKAFSQFHQARCIIFYSRVFESPWECPQARILQEKFSASGWSGQCLILKGHYREFRDSYSKHIMQNSASSGIGEFLDTISTGSGKDAKADAPNSELSLDEVLSRLAKEGLPHSSAVSMTAPSTEQLKAMEEQERQLEAELQSRHPDLHRKWQDIPGNISNSRQDRSGIEAQMVEHLDRGLRKMRSEATTAPAITYDPGHTKLAAEACFDRPPSRGPPQPALQEAEPTDEYVEISRGGEQFAGDPGYPMTGARRAELDGSGGSGGSGNSSSATASNSTTATPDEQWSSSRRGRGGGGAVVAGNLLNKVFRRG